MRQKTKLPLFISVLLAAVPLDGGRAQEERKLGGVASYESARDSVHNCTRDREALEILLTYIDELNSSMPGRCEDTAYAGNYQVSQYVRSVAQEVQNQAPADAERCRTLKDYHAFVEVRRSEIGTSIGAVDACPFVYEFCVVATQHQPLRLRYFPHTRIVPRPADTRSRSDSFAKGEHVFKKAQFRNWVYVVGPVTSNGSYRHGWSARQLLNCGSSRR